MGHFNFFFVSTKGRDDDQLQLQLLFVHEGPLRATKGHEELQRQNGKGRTARAKGQLQNGNCNIFCLRRATVNTFF